MKLTLSKTLLIILFLFFQMKTFFLIKKGRRIPTDLGSIIILPLNRSSGY